MRTKTESCKLLTCENDFRKTEKGTLVSIASHIRQSYEMPSMIVKMYLEDLADEELFVRPHENMNHIAWQLGHLIASENFHLEQVAPGKMPPLPEGFRERHSKETASSDDPSAFCSKAEYLKLMEEQRAGTLRVLEGLSDEDLSKPVPEAVSYLGPTVGAVFAGDSTHWIMHAGQWAVVRRKLGKPPLF